MGHLRISNELIASRVEGKSRGFVPKSFLFTQSHWHAIAYVGDGKMVLENGYVDPWPIFPRKVMHCVDYGIKFGLIANVCEYVLVENKIGIGAILSLSDHKGFCVGFYAVCYDAETRESQKLMQVHITTKEQ